MHFWLPSICSADVDDANPVAQLVRSERHAALARALRRLPTRDQELLTLLCAAAPPSYREISRRLAMPIGSIGPTRQRALARLREELLKDPRFDASPVLAVLATRTAR